MNSKVALNTETKLILRLQYHCTVRMQRKEEKTPTFLSTTGIGHFHTVYWYGKYYLHLRFLSKLFTENFFLFLYLIIK